MSWLSPGWPGGHRGHTGTHNAPHHLVPATEGHSQHGGTFLSIEGHGARLIHSSWENGKGTGCVKPVLPQSLAFQGANPLRAPPARCALPGPGKLEPSLYFPHLEDLQEGQP